MWFTYSFWDKKEEGEEEEKKQNKIKTKTKQKIETKQNKKMPISLVPDPHLQNAPTLFKMADRMSSGKKDATSLRFLWDHCRIQSFAYISLKVNGSILFIPRSKKCST